MTETADEEGLRVLAERVRGACLEAARRGYQEAAMSGLCCEGAWEAALGAVEMLDVAALVEVGGS